MKRVLKLPVDDELMALLEENKGDYNRYSELIIDALTEHFTTCSKPSSNSQPGQSDEIERLERLESYMYDMLETVRSISSRVDDLSSRIEEIQFSGGAAEHTTEVESTDEEFEWVEDDSGEEEDAAVSEEEAMSTAGVIDLENAPVMEMPKKILHLPGEDEDYDEETIYGDDETIGTADEGIYNYEPGGYAPAESYDVYTDYADSGSYGDEKWPYETQTGNEATTENEGDESKNHRAKLCPYCGGKLTFIEEYGRHYCYHCEEYITEKDIKDSIEKFTVEKKKEKGFLYRLLYGE